MARHRIPTGKPKGPPPDTDNEVERGAIARRIEARSDEAVARKELVALNPGLSRIDHETLGAARVDEGQVFMLFGSFCGDIFKTATAAGITPTLVTELAERGNWMERLRGLIDLKQSAKPGDVERMFSRATNFVQVNRMRIAIDRVLRKLDFMSDDDLIDFITLKTFGPGGELKSSTVSLKMLADFATAMEKVHWMTYQALLDAPTDRQARREKVKEDPIEEDIHARIAKALTQTPALDPAKVAEAAADAQSAHLQKVIEARRVDPATPKI
jgi:hypothetical protein